MITFRDESEQAEPVVEMRLHLSLISKNFIVQARLKGKGHGWEPILIFRSDGTYYRVRKSSVSVGYSRLQTMGFAMNSRTGTIQERSIS